MPERAGRRRADLVLLERGLFDSRSRAQEAIAAGLVTADGAPVRKPSDLVAPDAEFRAQPPHPFVSRGGVKLAAALDRFRISPAGRVCLDLGASTGGFTEVLLVRGAARVYAVDVGHGQLHRRIAADPRVIGLEGIDARRLDASLVPEPIGLAVADLSFISLKLVLPDIIPFLGLHSYLIALVKPQFEVGRARVGKGGVVRDAAARLEVVDGLSAFASRLGWRVLDTMPSPILGGDGNREFLLGAERG